MNRASGRPTRTASAAAGTNTCFTAVVAASLTSAGLLLLGCGKTASGLEEPTAFDLDHDIFAPSCAFTSCHGGETPAAGLNFARGLCGAMLQRPSCLFLDRTLAVPGEPDSSFLVDKLMGRNLAAKPATSCSTTNQRMPIGGVLLSEGQIARVAAWIAAGASCSDADGGAGDGGKGDAASDGGAGDGRMLGAPDVARPDGGGRLLALDPPALFLRAGEEATVTLSLSPPAAAGGVTVTIDTSDRDALAVPAAVFVDAGMTKVRFLVLAKRPASGQRLSASLAESRAEAPVSIDGLFLAEIFFGDDGGGGTAPGADARGGGSGAQWLKVVNTSSVAVALSDYVVGSGRTSYGDAVGALAGVLEPGACWVVGGPDSNASNGSPTYDQILDFSPDLHRPALDRPAVGVGLFAAGETDPTRAVPVDAVVAGPGNAAAGLIGPDGKALAAAVASLDPGHSLARDEGGGDWIDRALPAPDACPVLH